jgi:hypothetical protein
VGHKVRAYALPLLSLLISAAAAHAASTLNFPRLAFETASFTGIAIANPSATDAAVTLTAYGEDGKVLAGSGFVNPAQLTIKANQQIAKLTIEIFGAALPPSTIGWMQATSPADGLTGFFLFLDSSITFLDGADLPASSQKISFQQVRAGSGFSSEIDIINPASAIANVQAELVSAGAPRITKVFTIPAKGVKRFDAGVFFGVSEVSAGAYLLLQSDVEIGGTEFVKNSQGELLGLNARSVSEQLDRLVFPQLAVLGDYSTELGVINYSSSPAILTITAFRADGTLFDASDLKTNPVTRTLDGGASLREDVAAMFGFSGSSTLTGWIEVKSTAAAINGYVTFGIPASGAAAAVTTAAKGRTRALFSHIATAGYFTGIAALNPGALTANIRIVALRPTGEVLGSYDGVLQPGARISRLVGSELIPEAANQNGGLIWVKSDLPIYLAEIFGSNQVLANVPPQDAPAAFAPDAALATLRMKPPLVVLKPNQTQTFQLEGGSGTLDWKVNGRLGGQGSTGTITAAGVFTAPSAVPARQVAAITAESSKQAVGASVDVLDKTALAGSFRVVQSVAYLSALSKLFAAEFTALSGFREDPQAVESGNSQVVEVAPGGAKTTVVTVNGENIRKLVPFTGRDGREYLLMSGQAGGRIIRLNPATREMRDVVTGLKEPSSLVLDPSTGDLLVAEKDKISTVARTVLDAGLSPAAAQPESERDRFPGGRTGALPATISFTGAEGLVIDRCTGKLYLTSPAEGLLLEYDAATGKLRTVLSGLREPGAQLALYRAGGSCPNSFQLLVSERGFDRTILWTSGEPTFIQWLAAAGVNDLLFLPAKNPFASSEGVVLGENTGSAGSLSVAPTANLYAPAPPNPPPATEEAPPSRADVVMTAAVTPDAVSVGGTLTYTFTVTNRGPAAGTNVNLRLTPVPLFVFGLPTITATAGGCGLDAVGAACAIPSLAANGRAVVTVRVSVNARPSDGVVTVTATATTSEIDPDVTNNTATIRATVSGGSSDDLTPLPCSQEYSLRSIESTTLTGIRFVNASTQSINVYWLDFSGQRLLYFTLAPGQTSAQGTYVTHPWVVTGSSGACLGIYLPAATFGVATIR